MVLWRKKHQTSDSNAMRGGYFTDDAGSRKDHKARPSSTFSKPMIFTTLALVLIFLLSSASSTKSEEHPLPSGVKKATAKKVQKKAAFELTCSGFANGTVIPMMYARDGQNLSPPLEWSGAPEGTESFALIVDDPDAPTPKPWVHWIIYNIPASQTSLANGEKPVGAMKEGLNSWNLAQYDGPQPPKGQIHLYIFKLYALNTQLFKDDTSPKAKTKEQLEQAFSGHVLGEARWTGKFSR